MSYSSGKLFQNTKINILCDRLMKEIYLYFNDNTYVDAHFGLTGKAALLLQTTNSGNVENIVFITNEDDIYTYLVENAQQLLVPKLMMKYKERILLDFDTLKVEIWKHTGNLTFNTLYDVKLQEIDKIPQILL